MDQLERERQKNRSILLITRAVGSTLALDDLLDLLVSKFTELMEADRTTLYLLDDSGDELWTKVLEGEGMKEIRLRMGRGIAGWVAQSGESVRIEDAYLDQRFNQEVDLDSGYRTRSILCVPMLNHMGRMTGVVQVLNKKGGPFTSDDEEVLTALASHASVAIDNSRLYLAQVEQNRRLMATQEKLERRALELDLLLEVEKQISEAESLEELLDRLLERTTEIIGAEASSVVLCDHERQRIYFSNATGQVREKIKTISVPLGKGICGWVISHGQTACTNDPLNDTRYHQGIAEQLDFVPANILCVPLLGHEGTLGAVELLNKVGGRDFDHQDRTLLILVASRIAHAIHLDRVKRDREVQNRLASIGQALSSLVHDLRTPLTIISGYAQLITEAEDRAQRTEFAENIVKQTAVLTAMTQEVLAFARGESRVLIRKVYLNRFLKDMEEHLRHLLTGHDITLEMDARYTAEAYFDEPKMRRVFHNLARNAAEAMPHGGTYTCKVDRQAGRLLLTFSDTGVGMPDEMEGKVFQLFATSGKENGTGLGLAIVERIVREHDGLIDYSSKAGEGTTFTISLPAERGQAPMATSEWPLAPAEHSEQ